MYIVYLQKVWYIKELMMLHRNVYELSVQTLNLVHDGCKLALMNQFILALKVIVLHWFYHPGLFIIQVWKTLFRYKRKIKRNHCLNKDVSRIANARLESIAKMGIALYCIVICKSSWGFQLVGSRDLMVKTQPWPSTQLQPCHVICRDKYSKLKVAT